MATNPYPSVDLDLFVKSMVAGSAVGRAEGSMFSNFAGGLMKGYDDSIKNEALIQQNAIRQNQIEQLPVQNRIQEANAVQQEAQVALYEADPQKFVEAQQAAQQNEINKQAEFARLQQQETEFIDIMKGPDEAAKLEAMQGGVFTEYLMKKPQARTEVLKQARGWKPEFFEPLYEGEYAEIRARNIAETKVKAEFKLEDASNTYNSSANIGQLEMDVAALKKDEPINRLDLVTYGEVRTEPVYDKIERAVPNTNGQGPGGVGPRMEMIDDLSKEPKMVQNYYFGKGPVKEKIRSITKDTFHDYESMRTTFRDANDLTPHSGGITDLQNQARRTAKQRDEENAKLTAEIAEKNKQFDNDSAKAYSSGMAVATPPFQPTPQAPPVPNTAGLTAKPQFKRAMEASKGQLQANRNELTQEATVTEAAPAPVATGIARARATQAPLTPTPAPTGTPAPQVSGAPSPGAPLTPTPVSPPSKSMEIQERAKLKVSKIKEKYGMQPVSAEPTDVIFNAKQQVASLTPARYMPDTMTPRITTKFRPNEKAIAGVNSLPETKYAPAIVRAIIAQESAGKGDAVSKTGVYGLAQMQKSTAEGLFDGFDRTNPAHNVMAATTMFEVAMKNRTLKENPVLAIASYNGGEPVVADAVRLAGGSTDWNEVKKFIPLAVSRNKSLSKIKGKSNEILEYVDKVVSYFPAFATTSSDYETAKQLRKSGLLDFEDKEETSLRPSLQPGFRAPLSGA